MELAKKISFLLRSTRYSFFHKILKQLAGKNNLRGIVQIVDVACPKHSTINNACKGTNAGVMVQGGLWRLRKDFVYRPHLVWQPLMLLMKFSVFSVVHKLLNR